VKEVRAWPLASVVKRWVRERLAMVSVKAKSCKEQMKKR
jgi:hypothetical protein